MQATSPNYYSDGDSPDAGAGGDKPSEGKTAMLNKAVCGSRDCSPGSTITLKVVKDHGDELEVECCGGDDSSPSDSESQSPAPDGGMQSMLED